MSTAWSNPNTPWANIGAGYQSGNPWGNMQQGGFAQYPAWSQQNNGTPCSWTPASGSR
jgi:hypothetical protein